MKKFVIFCSVCFAILCALTLFSCSPEPVIRQSYYCDGFMYTENLENGTIASYTISVRKEPYPTASNIIIPETYNGLPVTRIEGSFKHCENMKSIMIPDSVTSIGASAFNACKGLTSIQIPDSVVSIEDRAFSNCTGLKTLRIGKGVARIGEKAFSGCNNLTAVNITDMTAWLSIRFQERSDNPVWHAKKLYLNEDLVTQVTIPDNVTTIYDFAFTGCRDLTDITIGKGVLRIGQDAFDRCELEKITVSPENPVYHSEGNCLIETASKTLVIGCKNSIIPANGSVAHIGDKAFFECLQMESIVIPSGVISIGENAFFHCTNASFLEISDTVTSISSTAFAYVNCQEISLSPKNTAYHISEGCLIETATKTLIIGIANSTIPSDGSVTRIADYAFCGRSNDNEEITIPAGITSIGNYAFANYKGLVNLTIPDSVTSIGDHAFHSTRLEKVTIGKGVISIGESAFDNCHDLVSVTLPDGITGIGTSAFQFCDKLTSINIPNSVTSIGSHAFFGCNHLETVIIDNAVAWTCTPVRGGSPTSLSATDIADSTKMAEHLRTTYCEHIWAPADGGLPT